MYQSKIIFSNNDELVLSSDDVLIGVELCHDADEPFLSMSKTVTLEGSHHDGLIPSILSIVCQYPYFYGPDGIETIYNSSAIVKIENI